MNPPEWYTFFTLGVDYYIAGRYAVLAGLNPVAGNIIHHAIEMFLKGGLSKKGRSLDDLKNRFSHRLPRIWEAFKSEFKDQSLAQFDNIVSSLHKFEDIRYPDRIVKDGMQSIIGITKHKFTTTSRPEPMYELYLQDIDSLVGQVFATAGANPRAYLDGIIKADAKKYLLEDNQVASLTG